MLQGSGAEAASAAAEQQAGSQSGDPSSQSRDDSLWKDVPGFAAGDSWFSADRGTADRGTGARGAEQGSRGAEQGGRGTGRGSRGEEAGQRNGGVQWQPRDPWRYEVVSPAAGAAAGGARREATAHRSDGVDEAIRGFNNDPAAGPVSATSFFAPSSVDADAVLAWTFACV